MADWLALARAHAPLLCIAAPLCGAAAATVAPGPRLSWVCACIGVCIGAVVAVDLALRALIFNQRIPIAAEGAALETSGLAVFCAATVLSTVALSLFSSGASIGRDFNARSAPLAMALAAAAPAAWVGALYARDMISIFAAAEAAWFASLSLVALTGERDAAALNGAMRMLVMGGVSAAFMLLGASLAARGLGSPALAAFDAPRLISPPLAALGAGLMFAALSLKVGIAPLHAWSSAAYGRCSGAVMAVSGVAALSVLARVAVAAIAAPNIGENAGVALAALGAVSVVMGSIQAIGARSVRRLAAYACAAQAGCVVMGLALGSPAGLAAALIQVLAMAAAMLVLIVGADAIQEARSLSDLDGMGKRAPLAAAALTFSVLSQMGAPLTIGFLGRWRLIEAGVGGDWWWTATAMIGASLAAVIYGGRIIERIYFRRAEYLGAQDTSFWRVVRAPALIFAILVIVWGLEPSWLLRAASAAAQLDLGEGS